MAAQLACESELVSELAIGLAAQLAAELDHELMPQHAAGLALACACDQPLEPKAGSGLIEQRAMCSCHGGLYALCAQVHRNSANTCCNNVTMHTSQIG